jgi:hypothetical protein
MRLCRGWRHTTFAGANEGPTSRGDPVDLLGWARARAQETEPVPAPVDEPAPVTTPAPAPEPAPTPVTSPTASPEPKTNPGPAKSPEGPEPEKKVASWEVINPGIMILDLALGFSYTATSQLKDPSQAGEGGSTILAAPIVGISMQAPLLTLISGLDAFFLDKRWRVDDYERIGVAAAPQGSGSGPFYKGSRSSTWLGFEVALGLQGVFRVSNLADLGFRVFRGAIGDANFQDVDDGDSNEAHTLYGTWYLNPRIRIGRLYVDYTRSLPSGPDDNHRPSAAVNMVEVRYALGKKESQAIGLRADFALHPSEVGYLRDYDSTHFSARVIFTPAIY